jgi:hypothetical protein
MKIKPKWKTNRFRPVESKSVAARYSFKEFQDFKKPFTLEKGFKMYKLQPHKTPDKEEEGSSSEKKKQKRERERRPKLLLPVAPSAEWSMHQDK